jgi:hypothetical protein
MGNADWPLMLWLAVSLIGSLGVIVLQWRHNRISARMNRYKFDPNDFTS